MNMYYIKLFVYYTLYAGRLILLTGFGAIAYVTTSITEYVRGWELTKPNNSKDDDDDDYYNDPNCLGI